MRETLRARSSEDGDIRVLSAPTVGRYLSPPPLGTFLSPGAGMGMLRVLQKGYFLTVPSGVSGVVREVLVKDRATPVEYGQPLLRLGQALDGPAGAVAESEGGAASDDQVEEGMIAVRSPTDGIFYSRPSPDEPSYVAAGDTVERGKVLGLVEVMKCFNQIAYGGEPDAPQRAVVVRVVPEDSAEVNLGQVLFVLDPS